MIIKQGELGGWRSLDELLAAYRAEPRVVVLDTVTVEAARKAQETRERLDKLNLAAWMATRHLYP